MEHPYTIRVRALIDDGKGHLILIKRSRTGLADYWVAPGGKVEESDINPIQALKRELAEEIGAVVTVGPLAFEFSKESNQHITYQSFYFCKLDRYIGEPKTGPEFSDPERGLYDIVTVVPDITLAKLNIVPPELKTFLVNAAMTHSLFSHR